MEDQTQPTSAPVLEPQNETSSHDPFEVTKLTPVEEAYFQAWAKKSRIKDLDQPASKYDYRGYWKANGPVEYRFGLDHLPDTYKQHGHPTFSIESKYSKGPSDGGMWIGQTYFPQPKPMPAHEPKEPTPAPDTNETSTEHKFDKKGNLASTILKKATSIGPPKPGASLVPDGPIDQLMGTVVGRPRPASLAAEDPYGLSAMEQGKGPVPVMPATVKKVGNPNGWLFRMAQGEVPVPEAPTPPVRVNAPNPQLDRLRVQTFIQRLKADPDLAYHPGLQQIPEFQEAFKVLNPSKKMLGTGEKVSKTSITNELDKMPMPPSASGSNTAELMDAAKAASYRKDVRSPMTYTEVKAEKIAKDPSLLPQRVNKNTQVSHDDVRAIRKMAKDGWNTAEIHKKFPNSAKSTILGIVNGDSFGWVK